MEVDVRIQGTDSADAIRRYATRRIHAALGRFAPRVGRIVVRISDINGVRGGVDQCCQIRAELLPKGEVVLDQVDADLFNAIDGAGLQARGPAGSRCTNSSRIRENAASDTSITPSLALSCG
jgi:hypothetical protein